MTTKRDIYDGIGGAGSVADKLASAAGGPQTAIRRAGKEVQRS